MDLISTSPDETFALGRRSASKLVAGDLVLLYGGLGAGKTLFTKGILDGLEYDVDEVTSPSFALVNLYKTARFDVYHIDLWRVEKGDAAEAIGLDEIIDQGNNVVIIEWADRLAGREFSNRTIRIKITGDGEEERQISYNGFDKI